MFHHDNPSCLYGPPKVYGPPPPENPYGFEELYGPPAPDDEPDSIEIRIEEIPEQDLPEPPGLDK